MLNVLMRFSSSVLCVVFFTSSVAQAACVISKKAPLRKEPKPKSPVVMEVGRYTPLLEIKRQGSWVQVRDIENQQYWVPLHHLNTSNKMQCLAIRTNKANLYKTAGGGKAELEHMSKFTPFKKIGRDEENMEWIQVEDDYGQKYFLHESNVWEPLKQSRLKFEI